MIGGEFLTCPEIGEQENFLLFSQEEERTSAIDFLFGTATGDDLELNIF